MTVIGVDTALQNLGLVQLDYNGKADFAFKPFSRKDAVADRLSSTARINHVFNWFKDKVQPDVGTFSSPKLVALEDYVLTGHQKAYETAELMGLLKNYLWENKIDYILVHPSKTLKYVVKRKEVSKTEIIQYVKERDPAVFTEKCCGKNIAPADHTDIADAWVIAQIGRMVQEYQSADEVRQAGLKATWESRWVELLLTDGSGILTKPGLCNIFPRNG